MPVYRICVDARKWRKSYFNRFTVFVWTAENYSNTPSVYTIFSKTKKKISVFKNIRIPVEGASNICQDDLSNVQRISSKRKKGARYVCAPFPSSKSQSLRIPVSRFQRLEFLWVSTGNGCHRVLVDKGNEGLGDETRRLPTLGQRGSMRCSETPLTMSGSFQCPWPATGIRSS